MEKVATMIIMVVLIIMLANDEMEEKKMLEEDSNEMKWQSISTIANERKTSARNSEENKLKEKNFGSIGRLDRSCGARLLENEILPAKIALKLKQTWKHFEKEEMKKDTNAFGFVNTLRWLMPKWKIRDYDGALLSLGSRLALLQRLGDDSGIGNDMNDESILERMIAMYMLGLEIKKNRR